MVEGCFIGLPQNKKGYMVSDSQNPLRVYVSYDVMFVETPETSKHITIQIDEEVPKSDGSPMDIERKNSKVENLVAEDNNVGKGGTTETTVENTPVQLHQSTRVKHTSTQDDDLWYSVTSYSRQKVPGESEEPQNTVLVMKDPVTYKEAISRNDTVYWKKACRGIRGLR